MWPTKIWGAVWSDPRCIKMWPSISFWSLFFEFLLIPAMAWLMPCFFLLEALCFTSGHVFSLLSRHLNTFSLFQSCWLDGPFAIWLVTLSKQRMTICSTWVKHVWNSVIPNPDHTRVFFPSRLVIVSDKSQKRTCSQNYKFENAIELLVLCLIFSETEAFPGKSAVSLHTLLWQFGQTRWHGRRLRKPRDSLLVNFCEVGFRASNKGDLWVLGGMFVFFWGFNF